jgi:hypothetical protein
MAESHQDIYDLLEPTLNDFDDIGDAQGWFNA